MALRNSGLLKYYNVRFDWPRSGLDSNWCTYVHTYIDVFLRLVVIFIVDRSGRLIGAWVCFIYGQVMCGDRFFAWFEVWNWDWFEDKNIRARPRAKLHLKVHVMWEAKSSVPSLWQGCCYCSATTTHQATRLFFILESWKTILKPSKAQLQSPKLAITVVSGLNSQRAALHITANVRPAFKQICHFPDTKRFDHNRTPWRSLMDF